jgi:hypothetical protein
MFLEYQMYLEVLGFPEYPVILKVRECLGFPEYLVDLLHHLDLDQ